MSPAFPEKSTPSIWVVVPAFNEATRLGKSLANLCALGHQIVVVDDGSNDDTDTLALASPVWLLRHIVNCGQGAAIQTGIEFAVAQGADVVVTFDADGQHAATDIAALIEPIIKGRADVVLGSRFLGSVEGLTWGRRIVLKLGVLFTRVTTWLKVTDTHNGLRAFSRQAAQNLRITHDRMAHASEILDQVAELRHRYEEVPVTVRYNAETLAKGQSSWNAVRIAAELFVGRWTR
jgi:glycosyltransferase involved in cell wall biosynthesis